MCVFFFIEKKREREGKNRSCHLQNSQKNSIKKKDCQNLDNQKFHHPIKMASKHLASAWLLVRLG